MERITVARAKEHITNYLESRTLGELGARAAGATAIVLIPGAGVAWLAWCFLRAWHAARVSRQLRDCG